MQEEIEDEPSDNVSESINSLVEQNSGFHLKVTEWKGEEAIIPADPTPSSSAGYEI